MSYCSMVYRPALAIFSAAGEFLGLRLMASSAYVIVGQRSSDSLKVQLAALGSSTGVVVLGRDLDFVALAAESRHHDANQ